MNKFLETLFDEGQTTCFTESPHGYKVSHSPQPQDLYFSINALHPYKDLNPVQAWHRENMPRRADANVVCFRNFLVELDTVPLETQIAYVLDEVPVTSIVYSGGKSHHFILSLTEPVDAAKYRELAYRLLLLFPEADRTCKNPSRLSRLPFRFRPETGNEQKLIQLGPRLLLRDLEALLPEARLFVPKARTPEEARHFITPLIISAITEPDVFMVEHGMNSRNGFMYWLGCRFRDLALTEELRYKYTEMAYGNLSSTADFPFEEALMAARVRNI